MKYIVAMIILSGFCICVAAQEMVYRWVDESGTIHFTAQPPPGDVDYEIVNMESGQVMLEPGVDRGEPVDFMPVDLEQDRIGAADSNDRSPEERIQVCNQAREQLELLETRSQLVVGEDNGEDEMLEEDRRLELINETRAFIAGNC